MNPLIPSSSHPPHPSIPPSPSLSFSRDVTSSHWETRIVTSPPLKLEGLKRIYIKYQYVK